MKLFRSEFTYRALLKLTGVYIRSKSEILQPTQSYGSSPLETSFNRAEILRITWETPVFARKNGCASKSLLRKKWSHSSIRTIHRTKTHGTLRKRLQTLWGLLFKNRRMTSRMMSQSKVRTILVMAFAFSLCNHCQMRM